MSGLAPLAPAGSAGWTEPDGGPPAPVRGALMRHDWRTLTFLHWPYPPAAVGRLLPPGLRPQTWDGSAWVGLVPFEITVRGPLGGPLPGMDRVPETNVRTYVVGPDGRSGVWFFSLDIVSAAAVAGARAAWGLPYFRSAMTVTRDGPELTYRCRRRLPSRPVASLVRVRPDTEPVSAGGFEHYLTARFALWSRWAGRLTYTPAAHPPWALRRGTVLELDDGLVRAAGLPDPVGPPLVHTSGGVPVRVGRPHVVGRLGT